MVDFAKLKKNRKNSLKDLQEKLNTQSGKKEFKQDEREWQPTADSVGNGLATIRFLPPQEGTDNWVKMFSHGFKGPTGKWYIENSLTTLGEKDPVGEYNTELWNAGKEDEARKQKRRLSFFSNVLIIKDRGKPENNGTVRIYKYGRKIFEKLSEAMSPAMDPEGRTKDDPDYDPTNAFNPFDMWEGASFNVKIRQVAGYRNYDTSDFNQCGPIDEDDDKIKAIFEQTHNLDELVAPDQFKSRAELLTKMNMVLGLSDRQPVQVDAPEVEEAPKKKTMPAPSDTNEDDELAELLKEISGD